MPDHKNKFTPKRKAGSPSGSSPDSKTQKMPEVDIETLLKNQQDFFGEILKFQGEESRKMMETLTNHFTSTLNQQATQFQTMMGFMEDKFAQIIDGIRADQKQQRDEQRELRAAELARSAHAEEREEKRLSVVGLNFPEVEGSSPADSNKRDCDLIRKVVEELGISSTSVELVTRDGRKRLNVQGNSIPRILKVRMVDEASRYKLICGSKAYDFTDLSGYDANHPPMFREDQTLFQRLNKRAQYDRDNRSNVDGGGRFGNQQRGGGGGNYRGGRGGGGGGTMS